MASLDEIEFIQSIEIFNSLDDTEIADLLDACGKRKFSTGQMIMQQGGKGDSLIIIKDGKAAISIRGADGNSIRVAEVGRGAVIGEMALVDPAPRSATVIAEAEVLAYELFRVQFAKMGAARKTAFLKVMRAIATVLCGRLRGTYDKVGALMNPEAAAAQAAGGKDEAASAAGGSFFADLWGKIRGK